jgi:hypothetical protein
LWIALAQAHDIMKTNITARRVATKGIKIIIIMMVIIIALAP